MGTVDYIVFNCLNPECRKKIRLSRPALSGVYGVRCPYCGADKRLRLKGMDVLTSSDSPTQSSEPLQSAAPSPTPVVADNSSLPVIELHDDFIVGITYKITCPHCKKMEFGFVTEKPGHRAIPCPSCKGKCGVDVSKNTEEIIITEQLQMFKGKLILLRRGWLNKEFPLQDGKNVIGRYDEVEKSDIAIRNDSSISRRSVEIEVKRTDRGYSFKLNVLKATNPVLHNNNPLLEGESVSLNFGDGIIMGQTRFRFDKDVR